MDYYLCSNCERYLSPNSKTKSTKKGESETESSATCLVCLGVWDDDNDSSASLSFGTRLAAALQDALQPYATHSDRNYFCRHTVVPVVALPGDMIRRYQAIVRKRQSTNKSKPAFGWAQQIKAHTKQVLDKTLDEMEQKWHEEASLAVDSVNARETNDKEELGHLGVHVIVTAASDLARQHGPSKSSSRQPRNKRRNIDGPSQGGDARRNLELRIAQEQGTAVWSVNQALDDEKFKSKGQSFYVYMKL